MSVYAETAADGRTTFALAERAPQWYNMGERVPEGSTTQDMLDIAHLSNWGVKLDELVTSGRSHVERFEVNRTNPFDGLKDTLGIVGSRYRVFQNEELFAFGDNLLHGGEWEAAGAIKNGTVVFGAMKLNGDLYLGHDDAVERHLLLYTSHDGSSNISASIVALRMRCTNSLNLALRSAKQTFKVRHSSSMEGRVAEAREVLGLANVYFDEFSAEMNKLIDAQITLDEAVDIVKRVYPEPEADKKGALTRWDNKIDDIVGIYNSESCENVYGTRYGIMNAMTERLDWLRTPRGGNMENMYAAASGFDPVINAEKNRILEAVRV